jgi:hypothetical protein
MPFFNRLPPRWPPFKNTEFPPIFLKHWLALNVYVRCENLYDIDYINSVKCMLCVIFAWCGRASVDYGSEGLGFEPYSGLSKVRLFSLSILTDKIVLLVQSC